ncbi:MAG: hypothetical protein RI885_1546 [Actinomycetota bacterium]|jgi:molybdopterin-guanine dinucleotide biosynthesis protein A
MGSPPFSAIIVAGGRGSRLGGVDKAALEFDGLTLLERAIAATGGAARVCAVGPRRDSINGVEWVLEDPPGGGPSAALGAGIRCLSAGATPLVLVLAADLLRPEDAVPTLLDAARTHVTGPDGADGVVAVDESGHRQPLLAVYAIIALTRVLSIPVDGLALRTLLSGLRLVDVPVPDAACADVDTVEDARRHGIRLA